MRFIRNALEANKHLDEQLRKQTSFGENNTASDGYHDHSKNNTMAVWSSLIVAGLIAG